MNTYEIIGRIFDALFPLLMLCYGLVLGLALADWLAARANKDKKPDNDKQEDDSK